MPVLPNIPDSAAALMLRQERQRLTQERIELVREIEARQERIDRIDARLREVSDGERVLSEHGF
ncbi:hypothetical protein SEA_OHSHAGHENNESSY_116 [Mycobacterium phage OhShagHennessy]|uniref:Uncharacterized protein n=2 Tax=Bronvirus TaxID=1623278 RepID=A0A7U0GCS6_9CAUD|nr:hypothetical protein KNV76_gp107 [Mycobacterium phage OhShagHennessy]AEK07665.1 hypothetical protein UPIE_123 [Mycobacterium phage UPIE]AZS12269.1 hypothetical protein SEA_ACQUIRE49_124 [Mycobacterium phage Acquire49]QQV92821.1 hypothetical protein SEA_OHSHAGHENNESSY_116 [Mycobacterium phage OhShagHennessy]